MICYLFLIYNSEAFAIIYIYTKNILIKLVISVLYQSRNMFMAIIRKYNIITFDFKFVIYILLLLLIMKLLLTLLFE